MKNRLLAIDTATPACSVALYEKGTVIASDYQEIGRGHAEKLVPMIAELPDKGRACKIIVNCGPGSFTGIRIGLSAAKALALAWDAELCAYQCLHLVAAQALDEIQDPRAIYVAMNGGHGEYFVQNFSAEGKAMDDLRSLAADEALQYAKSDLFVGSGAQILTQSSASIGAMTGLPNAAWSHLLHETSRKLAATPIYGRSADAIPAGQK